MGLGNLLTISGYIVMLIGGGVVTFPFFSIIVENPLFLYFKCLNK